MGQGVRCFIKLDPSFRVAASKNAFVPSNFLRPRGEMLPRNPCDPPFARHSSSVQNFSAAFYGNRTSNLVRNIGCNDEKEKKNKRLVVARLRANVVSLPRAFSPGPPMKLEFGVRGSALTRCPMKKNRGILARRYLFGHRFSHATS